LAEALSRIERHGRSGVIFFYTIIEVIPNDKGRKAILRITFKELDAKKHFKKLTVVDWKKLMLGRILLILGMGTVFTSLATQVQANSVTSESSNSNSLTLSDNSLSCDGKSYRFRGLPTWGKQEPHRLFPMAFSQRELMYLPFRFQSQLPQFQLSERVDIFFGDTLEPGTPYRNIYEEFGDYKYFMS